MFRRLIFLGLCQLATSGSTSLLLAQEAPPKIHVATRLVQIGVVVRDKNGPIGDLRKDDFVLLDRGKPREIAFFTVEPRRGVTTTETLPENTFSDLPRHGGDAPRSITIVLLDNLNTLYGSAAANYETDPKWFEDLALANGKAHLVEFLKTLDPRDRVALYGLSSALHVLCDFTGDREQLLAILKKYDTTSATNREAVEPGAIHTPAPGAFNANVDGSDMRLAGLVNQRRAGITMDALRAIARHVANIPGRKNLVWLTANLPFSADAIASVLGPVQMVAYPIDARGLLTATPPGGVEGVMDEDAVALGNYMPAQSPHPIGVDTMLEMAEKTGGQAFINTNDLTGALRTAVEGSGTTYTLGFYLDASTLDGKFHNLKVQVKRGGLRLRYPDGYFAAKDIEVGDDQRSRGMVTAIASPVQASEIPMQVRIVRTDHPLPHSLSLFGSIDIHNLQLPENGGLHQGAVDVATIEQDETGKVLRRAANRITLNLSRAQYEGYLKTGFPFHQFVQPQEGVTTLRLVVEDAGTAEIGSVIVPLAEVQ